MSPPSVTLDCNLPDTSLGKISVFQEGARSFPCRPGFVLSSSPYIPQPQKSIAVVQSHNQTLQQELTSTLVGHVLGEREAEQPLPMLHLLSL